MQEATGAQEDREGMGRCWISISFVIDEPFLDEGPAFYEVCLLRDFMGLACRVGPTRPASNPSPVSVRRPDHPIRSRL